MMPNQPVVPAGSYHYVFEDYTPEIRYEQHPTSRSATGNGHALSLAHALPIPGSLVPMSNGRHIFYDDEGEQSERNKDTPGSSNHASYEDHDLPRRRYAQSARGSSGKGTPSAQSSSTNTVARSTASSVTMHDSSDIEYGQRNPRAVDTSRMDQIQLFSDFLEMHFPTPAAKADLANRRSYLMGLPEIDLSSAPMLRSAVEAICYAHAGSNYNDQRMIQRSQRAYGKVLSSLVRCLNSGGTQNDPRIIVPSIMLLTLYDDALPEAKSTGWQAHYWGVHEYLRATGPSAFPMSEPFSRLLFLNLRIPTMFLGIARRKAVVLSEPQWRILGNVSGLGATPLGRLYPRALQLPGLLERVDSFLRQNSYDGIQDLIHDITTLRSEFITWSMTESSFADRTMKYYTAVDANDDDKFDLGIEEHLVMCSNSTFDTYFDFVSYKVAQDYALYWIFALILECALLRIMHFRSDTEKHIKPRNRAETERDASNRAKYLCRSAYFFSKFDSQGITSFLDALVALAETFFSEIEAIRELGWCQSLRVANQMRLARLRKKQPKTLCRMGDMVADLASATKFKSRHVSSGR